MKRSGVLAVASVTGALTAAILLLVDYRSFVSVNSPGVLVTFIAVGWAFVAAGVAAWRTRPHDNTGRLTVIAGLLWLVWAFNFSSNSIAFTVGGVLVVTYSVAIIQVLLGYPLGRLRTRWERWFVAGCYVYSIGSAMTELAFGDPGPVGFEHEHPVNLLLIRDDPGLLKSLQMVFAPIDLAIAFVVLAVLITRWRKGTPAYRAAFAPLWLATLVGTAMSATVFLVKQRSQDSTMEWVTSVNFAAIALVPLAIVVGLWRYRGARAASQVMVEVGAAPLGEGFTTALRRALRDPSLVLWSWSPELAEFVDADGVVHELPGDGEDRAATVLENDSEPVGALVYDQSLRDQPQLIAAVRSATVVTLDNQRLQTELEAQLEEVRRSRGRIVSSGDEQRRRLERDLHDGAQQRLVAAAILLRRAQRSMNEQQLRDLLSQGAAELDLAVTELRELARGVYPPVLKERGLGAALDSLAERTPLPLEIRDELTVRPGEAVELAAYYIAAEAVANATKHSSASLVEISLRMVDGALRVTVSDDGCGGAGFTPGGGLSGLQDRAAALAGTLTLDSPVAGGTVLTVDLPTVDLPTVGIHA